MITCLCGDIDRLIDFDFQKDMLKKEYANSSYYIFDLFQKEDLANFWNNISNFSFISSHRIFFLKNGLSLFKDNKNAIEKLSKLKISDIVLIEIDDVDFKISKKIEKYVSDTFKVLNISKENRVIRLANFIKTELNIDEKDAYSLIYNYLGDNFYNVKSEIEKIKNIKNFSGNIKEIEKFIYKSKEDNIFDVIKNFIYSKEKEKALKYVEKNGGMSFLYNVANEFKILYKLIFIAEKHSFSSNYKDFMSNDYPKISYYFNNTAPYGIFVKIKEINKFSTKYLLQGLNNIFDIEKKIKTGLLSENDGVQMFILSM